MKEKIDYEIIVEDIDANIEKFHEVMTSLFKGKTVEIGDVNWDDASEECVTTWDRRTVLEFVITQICHTSNVTRTNVIGTLPRDCDHGSTGDYSSKHYEIWAGIKEFDYTHEYIGSTCSTNNARPSLLLIDGVYKVHSVDLETGAIDPDWPIFSIRYAKENTEQ